MNIQALAQVLLKLITAGIGVLEIAREVLMIIFTRAGALAVA